MTELRDLDTEGRRAGRRDLDLMSSLELLTVLNDEDQTVAPAVRRALPQLARSVDAIAARMVAGGRLAYVGAGTAGRLGALDAAEIVPTFGLSPDRVVAIIAGGPTAATTAVENVEDDAAAGAAAVAEIGRADAVVGIAASGRTPFTLSAVRAAHDAGAFTTAVVCNLGSPLAAAADVAVEVIVGPEVVAGSTRLKAGTAQKLVLNSMSTAVMVALGKTYGDLMVDVRPTNAKLRARALRIVAEVTGCGDAAAATALHAAGGDVRAAIVHVATGGPMAVARELVAAKPALRDVLASVPARSEGGPPAPLDG